MSKYNDVQLVRAAQSGDDRAFEELYRRYYEKIYALAKMTVKNDEDAEDVLQLTFIKAWQNLDRLADPSAFNTWLQRIALNECHTFLRKRKPEQSMDEEGEDGEVVQIETDLMIPEQYAEREDLSARLNAVINDLSMVQKETILLYYFNEMSVGEIAQIMDCSEGTVKSRLYLARRAIKTEIEEIEQKTGERFYGIAGVVMVPFGGLLIRYIKSSCISAQKAASLFRSVSDAISPRQAQYMSKGNTARRASSSSRKHAAASGARHAAKSTLPLWGKIAIGGVIGALIIGGGIAAWNIIKNASAASDQPDSVVQETELQTESAETQTLTEVPTEAPTEAPTVIDVDPSTMPQSLDAFLTEFNYGYTEKEYDCLHPENVYDTLPGMIVGNPSCVDSDIYPGEKAQQIWQPNADPLGRFDQIGTTVFEESKLLWIMENIFNLSDETSRDMLSASLESDERMYEYEQDGKMYLYRSLLGIGQGGYFYTYKTVRFDGERYYFVYDVTSGYGNSIDAPNMITDTYYAEMAQKEIDGETYWTIYRHSETIPELPAVTGSQEDSATEAQMSFADLPDEFIFTSGVGAWATMLQVSEDGSFTGSFSDQDSNEFYVCDFHGQLGEIKKVSEYLYQADILSVEADRPSGTETDGPITYHYADEGRGFPKDSKVMSIYLPDAPYSSFSDKLKQWILLKPDDSSDSLGYYVLAVDDLYAFCESQSN